jgi:hypothetical protein
VTAELPVELALEIESLRHEPFDDRAHRRYALPPLASEGGAEQAAPLGRIVVRWMKQIGMRLDNAPQLRQIGGFHGLHGIPHRIHLPFILTPPEFRRGVLEQHVPAWEAGHARHGQARVVLCDGGGEDVAHGHPVESRHV